MSESNRTAAGSRKNAAAMLARHNVESPVVSPRRPWTEVRPDRGGVAQPRRGGGARRARAADAGAQLRAAGVGTPSSAVAQDVVVRMRARVAPPSACCARVAKGSLLQACAMWRAWTLQLAAGVAPLTCRAEVAAAQRGDARRAVGRGPRARAATRCSARSTGCAASSRRRGRRSSRDERPPRTTTSSRRATRRRGDLVARSQKAQGEEAQRQVRASTNALRRQQHITHLLRRGAIGLSLAAAVTRGEELAAAAALAKWRRSVLLLQLGLAR